MFVDASALCAVLLNEPEAHDFAVRLGSATVRLTSAVAVFETVRALMRVSRKDVATIQTTVANFLDQADIRLVPIGEAESAAALDAMDRFGKGRHPAQLNLGDCFAYACARTHSEPLLFKGDDFARTDIAAA